MFDASDTAESEYYGDSEDDGDSEGDSGIRGS